MIPSTVFSATLSTAARTTSVSVSRSVSRPTIQETRRRASARSNRFERPVDGDAVAGEVPGGDRRVQDGDADRVPERGVDPPGEPDQAPLSRGPPPAITVSAVTVPASARIRHRPPGRPLQGRDQAADEADRMGEPPGIPERQVEQDGDQDLVFQSHLGGSAYLPFPSYRRIAVSDVVPANHGCSVRRQAPGRPGFRRGTTFTAPPRLSPG